MQIVKIDEPIPISAGPDPEVPAGTGGSSAPVDTATPAPPPGSDGYKPGMVFVDANEDGKARLLGGPDGSDVFTVPGHPDLKEGTYIPDPRVGAPAPEAGAPSSLPGSAPLPDSQLDAIASKGAYAPPGAPAAATPPATATGTAPDNGLPDVGAIEKKINDGTATEGDALDKLGQAKQDAADKISQARDDQNELRDKQAVELAAEQQFVHDRQQAIDASDAANLKVAQEKTIPDFWAGHEGARVGAAITVALSGFFGGALAGATGQPVHNQALDVIQKNVDSYFGREKEKIDNLYKYAEMKGKLDDKVKAQYADQLTDLMQRHALVLASAADRIQQVTDESQGHVDAAQASVIKAKLLSDSAETMLKTGALRGQIYNYQSEREKADADMVRANAAMAKAKAHKGGGGGGDALGAFVTAASQLKPGDPITPEIAELGRKAGLKPNQVATEADKYRNSADKASVEAGKLGTGSEKEIKPIQTEFDKDETRLKGSPKSPGLIMKQQDIRELGNNLRDAVSKGDAQGVLAAAIQAKEKISRLNTGAAPSGHVLDFLNSLTGDPQKAVEKVRQMLGSPQASEQTVGGLVKLIDQADEGALKQIDKERQNLVTKYIGPSGMAQTEAQRRHAMGRMGGIFSQTTSRTGTGEVPRYAEGTVGTPVAAKGASAAPASGPAEGTTSKTASGVPIVFRGGKWTKS